MKDFELKELVSDGKIFSVVFVKRTTGEIRHMIARTGVDRRHGGIRSWSDKDKNVLTVWDVEKGGYRCIPLENIVSIKHHGREVKL